MREGFALNLDGTRIHFIDNGFHADALPLFIVPGMMGVAEHHQLELEHMPRRVIAMSHRGLGRNAKISSGQGGFEARVGDIAAVVGHLELEDYLLYGFSRGVPMAAEHAIRYPRNVRGLILHDCVPRYARPSESWRDRLQAMQSPWMPAETVHAYWHDAEDVDLSSRLHEILCPTLLLRGALEGTMLPSAEAERLCESLPQGKIQVLAQSGHEIGAEDVGAYISILRDFCQALDGQERFADLQNIGV